MFHTKHYTFFPCSSLNSMQVRLENHLTLSQLGVHMFAMHLLRQEKWMW